MFVVECGIQGPVQSLVSSCSESCTCVFVFFYGPDREHTGVFRT